MKVLFFAQCREATGCAEFHLSLEKPVMEAEFWSLLIKAFPSLEIHRKVARLARNESYLQKDDVLQPGDEIAVIPPVSGG
jgi:molybdopterin converting factor subunit 1